MNTYNPGNFSIQYADNKRHKNNAELDAQIEKESKKLLDNFARLKKLINQRGIHPDSPMEDAVIVALCKLLEQKGCQKSVHDYLTAYEIDISTESPASWKLQIELVIPHDEFGLYPSGLTTTNDTFAEEEDVSRFTGFMNSDGEP